MISDWNCTAGRERSAAARKESLIAAQLEQLAFITTVPYLRLFLQGLHNQQLLADDANPRFRRTIFVTQQSFLQNNQYSFLNYPDCKASKLTTDLRAYRLFETMVTSALW
jgi:hypothetical protein